MTSQLGTWEALLAWKRVFISWDGKNLSIKHVCSIKLLNHLLNYSYSMLFNPLVIVKAAYANTKRLFLFVSFLALTSTI